MGQRAAIVVGVNRAGGMRELQAAVTGASQFAAWAREQGCETMLLLDSEEAPVTIAQIFAAVDACVKPRVYAQLIVYFSGHGILKAPDAEYWLLAGSPANPNEAVNLAGSVSNARFSDIPHVIFISDACRSSVSGPPLNAVTGGVIFPSWQPRQLSRIDILYATSPGNPALEVAEDVAANGYRGVFTDNLLKAVRAPKPEWVATINDGGRAISVIASRSLDPDLVEIVRAEVESIDVKLQQDPELRCETSLPLYLATVGVPAEISGAEPGPAPDTADSDLPRPIEDSDDGEDDAAATAVGGFEEKPGRDAEQLLNPVGRAFELLHDRYLGAGTSWKSSADPRVEQLGQDVANLLDAQGRSHFETHTGFTVIGAANVEAAAADWTVGVFADEDSSKGIHIRLTPLGYSRENTLLLSYGNLGTVLPILPGFVGTVVVGEGGRVLSVNYVPSANTDRYHDYEAKREELERLKAFTAVASRNGRLAFNEYDAEQLARRIRQAKGIDPIMGLYASYAYAQAGRYEQVRSVFGYMLRDEVEIPVPFDVVMLASRYDPAVIQEAAGRIAPAGPMLAQGWALLEPDDPLFTNYHEQLRQHLVPALWTTLDPAGVRTAQQLLLPLEFA